MICGVLPNSICAEEAQVKQTFTDWSDSFAAKQTSSVLSKCTRSRVFFAFPVEISIFVVWFIITGYNSCCFLTLLFFAPNIFQPCLRLSSSAKVTDKMFRRLTAVFVGLLALSTVIGKSLHGLGKLLFLSFSKSTVYKRVSLSLTSFFPNGQIRDSLQRPVNLKT